MAGWAAFLTVVWWALAGNAAADWRVAPIAVAAALWVALRHARPAGTRLAPAGLLRFLPFFLWQSLHGGVDVVRRAFDPRLPLAPAFIAYDLRLPPGPPRIWFANTVSLLPGTLSARLGEDRLLVHVLDHRLPVRADLAVVERRVGAVFGLALADGRGAAG
jgi:multicomponent Na+:H+ antiporter subunit E